MQEINHLPEVFISTRLTRVLIIAADFYISRGGKQFDDKGILTGVFLAPLGTMALA